MAKYEPCLRTFNSSFFLLPTTKDNFLYKCLLLLTCTCSRPICQLMAGVLLRDIGTTFSQLQYYLFMKDTNWSCIGCIHIPGVCWALLPLAFHILTVDLYLFRVGYRPLWINMKKVKRHTRACLTMCVISIDSLCKCA